MSVATKESGHVDLSTIRWNDNVKPVDPEIEARAIKAYVNGQRATTAKINRRIRRDDVKQLAPTALYILASYASGMTVSQVSGLGFRRPDVARVMTWANALHKLSGQALREIGQAADSPEAIVEAIIDYAAERKGVTA